MNERHLKFCTAILVAVSVVSSCNSDPTVVYRYRLTVEVQTPSGLVAGSSVIQVTNRELGGLKRGWADAKVNGEAVAVDLPGNRTLFALLRSDSGDVDAAAGYAPAALLQPSSDDGREQSWLKQLREMAVVGRSAELPRWRAPISPEKERQSQYPLFVTFAEMRDPKSVQHVDPNDFAKSFGNGVALQRIMVQITNDPITKGIERRLPWLGELDDFRTDPKNPFTNTLPTEIGGLRSNSK